MNLQEARVNLQEVVKAEKLREEYISVYLEDSRYGCNCLQHIKKEAEYHLRAYQMMTPEEILASEKRALQVQHEETKKKLEELAKFEARSRETRIPVG
ncbi:MAG: hypothetical protein AABX71_00345 [Nanoarchaeota archaeon]